MTIGLIREGKIPADTRVAFTPKQCKWIQENKNIRIIVQKSPGRCFKDSEYIDACFMMMVKDCLDLVFLPVLSERITVCWHTENGQE